jgi:hypothetical protein
MECVSIFRDPFRWREIQADISLQWLGAGLALTHVLTYFFWDGAGSLRSYLSGPVRVCWSFYQGCASDPGAMLRGVDAYFIFYLILGVVTVSLFLIRKTVSSACLLLLVLTLLKAAVLVQDYRLMGNYHYMPFWMTGAFLFFPRKKHVCAVLLALFYFGAGLLKLNPEWLSGAAMIRPPMISGKLLEWAVALVVFMELFLVFWIFSGRLWKRVAALATLVLFHAFSWHIVGFFYPMVMFSLLSFLVINVGEGLKPDWRAPALYPVPIVFLVCQLIPLLFFPNSAVTGEGRILALNMFDAKTVCQSDILLRNGTDVVELPPLLENLGVRIACDPLVHLAQARAYCEIAKEEDLPSISVRLVSKPTVAGENQTLLALAADDVCRQPPKVTWWGGIR